MMTKSNHQSSLHRGGILRTVLYDCSSLNSLDQFTEIVIALGESSNLIYLGDSLTLNGEVGHTAIEENQIKSLIGDKYEQSKIRISKIRRDFDPIAMPSLKFRAPFISKSKDFVRFFDDRFFTMNYTEYSDKPGAFSLSIPSGSFTINNSNRDFQLIESIMQFYAEITKELIHSIKPVHAWISEIDEYIPKIRRDPQDENPINVLFWSNFFSNKEFSPGFIHYIEQSTVGFSIPSDSGIWYQLSENFLLMDRKSMQNIVEEAYQYFSTKGIDHIIWG